MGSQPIQWEVQAFYPSQTLPSGWEPIGAVAELHQVGGTSDATYTQTMIYCRRQKELPPKDRKTLRQWRRDAGLSQWALCRLLGVGQTTISQWESGKGPIPDKHWPAIAAACGVRHG